jgi:hypothetical protein
MALGPDAFPTAGATAQGTVAVRERFTTSVRGSSSLGDAPTREAFGGGFGRDNRHLSARSDNEGFTLKLPVIMHL